jgi:signal transduction histidine kinase
MAYSGSASASTWRRSFVNRHGEAEQAVTPREHELVVKWLNAGIADAVAEYAKQRDLELQRQSSEHLGFIAHELRNPLGRHDRRLSEPCLPEAGRGAAAGARGVAAFLAGDRDGRGDRGPSQRPLVQRGENRTGFGLGLGIALQAAEAHNGTTKVRELPGEGCAFTIDLPGAEPKPRAS